jgi:hypothetical protein
MGIVRGPACWLPTSNTTSGADSGFNKTEIDLMFPGMVDREAAVQRLALALTLAATMLCYGSATRAQAGTAFYPVEFAACQPLPLGIRAVGN